MTNVDILMLFNQIIKCNGHCELELVYRFIHNNIILLKLEW
jgi:hypothetical protein